MSIHSNFAKSEAGFAHLILIVVLAVVLVSATAFVGVNYRRNQSKEYSSWSDGSGSWRWSWPWQPAVQDPVSSEEEALAHHTSEFSRIIPDTTQATPSGGSSESSKNNSSESTSSSSNPTGSSAASDEDTAWIVHPTEANCNGSFDIWAAKNEDHGFIQNGKSVIGTAAYYIHDYRQPISNVAPYKSALTNSGVKANCTGGWVCPTKGGIPGCGSNAYKMSDVSIKAPPN